MYVCIQSMMLFCLYTSRCVRVCMYLCCIIGRIVSTCMRLSIQTIHVPMKLVCCCVYMLIFKRKPHDTYPYFDVCCYISASRCSLNSLLLVFPFSLLLTTTTAIKVIITTVAAVAVEDIFQRHKYHFIYVPSRFIFHILFHYLFFCILHTIRVWRSIERTHKFCSVTQYSHCMTTNFMAIDCFSI